MVKYYKTKNLDSYYLEMVVPFVYTEEEYKKLEDRVKFLEEENKILNEKIKNMEKAEKDFMYIMKKYILNEGNLKKLETLYDICFEGK